MNKNNKTIVVIGGGIAGVEFIKEVDDECNLILIEPKDCFVMPYAIHRSIVYGDFQGEKPVSKEYTASSHQCMVPYDKLMKGKGCIIKAKLQDIDTKKQTVKIQLVSLEKYNYSTQYLKYDYLVIASGSTSARIDLNDSNQIYKIFNDYGKKIRESNSIAIVGCGALGYEFIGELLDLYSHKDLYLIGPEKDSIFYISNQNSQKDPMYLSVDKHRIPEYLSDFVLRTKINRIEYRVSNMPILNNWRDRIQFEKSVELENGQKIKFDAIIYCTGSKPIFDFTINEKAFRHYLKVDRMMKCTEFGEGKVYAIGDCCEVEGSESIPKMGSYAMSMARHCGFNLKNILNLKSEEGWNTLDESRLENTFLLTLGRNDGIGKIPTFKDHGILRKEGVQAIKHDQLVRMQGWLKLGYDHVWDKYKKIEYNVDDVQANLYLNNHNLNLDLKKAIISVN